MGGPDRELIGWETANELVNTGQACRGEQDFRTWEGTQRETLANQEQGKRERKNGKTRKQV